MATKSYKKSLKLKISNDERNDERKRKRNERIQNIQIGMGTVNNGVVPLLLSEFQLCIKSKFTINDLFLDIGAGWGNVLKDVVESNIGLNLKIEQCWGVEMNTHWKENNPKEDHNNKNNHKDKNEIDYSKYKKRIKWCKLEDVDDTHTTTAPINKKEELLLLKNTKIAFMYDLCLKRLTRNAQNKEEDPHYAIQNVLLDPKRAPSLKYFISTYEESKLYSLHDCKFQLEYTKKLSCSTGSYEFYVYSRIIDY